jgi:tRNA pseudouridine38-40 synthase
VQLRLIVEYEGTRFLGWQLQPGGPTVQGELERALAVVLREPVRVRGAGRTDAGVHARGQVAAARVAAPPADLARLLRSLNALLPDDVAAREVTLVDDAFDPRRHARSRVYEYRILATAAPSPFWRRWAWHVPRALDLAAMDAAARALVGEHDCAAFRGADAKDTPRSTVRRILESRLQAEPPLLTYRVEATAFLKHMVRNVVGTLVEVGLGERAAGCMAELLAGRDRTRAGATAPARGLTLVEVRY